MSTTVTCIGCSLLDQIYDNIDFSSPSFLRYQSHADGDGGIEPGKLVFADHLESFTGEALPNILKAITGDRRPDAINLGGPGVVASIHATQLLSGRRQIAIRFFGAIGSDEAGDTMLSIVRKTPLDPNDLIRTEGASPSTVVLSDPSYHDGHGERCFINDLGTAKDLSVSDIPKEALAADILFLGGTALVPKIHDSLSQLVSHAKSHQALTIVATVYDFRNQQRDPSSPWPLVSAREDFSKIDLLIMDWEEACRISGMHTVEEALRYFKDMHVGAAVITHGAHAVHLYADSPEFLPVPPSVLPISAAIDEVLAEDAVKRGDTTGCGDNLAGGVLASIADQREQNPGMPLDLLEAASWGIVSGGYSCLYFGGTYVEEEEGEKLKRLQPFYHAYRRQVGSTVTIVRSSLLESVRRSV